MTTSRRRGERAFIPAIMLMLGCAGGGANPAPSTGGGSGENGWTELESESPRGGPVMTVSGTVRHLEVEGGVYVIDDASGTRYNPMNLPTAFQADGKAVEAQGRRRDDVMSTQMVGPMLELVRIRARAGGATAAPDLAGTAWRLEDLAGAGVIDAARASLEFPEAGRASGSGSCNRFTGSVTITGATLAFGPLATTRKACPEALMNQERDYLAALGAAQRFEVKDGLLFVYGVPDAKPLRFSRE